MDMPADIPLSVDDLVALRRRVGDAHLRQRLNIQAHHAADVIGTGRTLFHIENAEWLMVILYHVLRATLLYPLGNRNFLDIRVVRNTVAIRHLPAAFEGFRLLQLSDLHLDIEPKLAGTIRSRLEGVEYDQCVITGDFRASTSGSFAPAIAATLELLPALKGPVYAILGNHDFIEMVHPLEEAGLRFLLNESVALERGGERVWLCGVDDPHFYEVDNMGRTCEGIPDGDVMILLCHAPESYRKAAALGFDLMLSGHTHGGQICLPGGIPLITNGNCPRRLVRGAWREKGMQGYTSPGTGGCGVPVRFFCPPEITLHTLVRE
jgi:predicted MPP superfamily phosphohydrolase